MAYIVKVPGINGLNHTRGCEKAGNAILETLDREIWTNESGKKINIGEHELEEIHLNNSNLIEANKLIYENAFESFDKKKVIFLGGDHSISYSLAKAFLDYCNSNLDKGVKEPCLIVLDAHPDLMKPVDRKIPTHEDWLRALIESGFPAKNILMVGLRGSDLSELQYIKEKKIKTISINSFLEDIENICEVIMEFASGKNLYLSVDIDIVDPAFAPATGYLEPGGLTSGQIMYLIQRMSKMKNLHAVDIVEINPEKDKQYNNITVKLGAKILGEFL